MWRLDRRARATLALIALAGVGSVASVAAQGEISREHHEQRQAAARQTHHTQAARADGARAAARREALRANQHPVVSHQQKTVARTLEERRVADGNLTRATHAAADGRGREPSRGLAGSQVRFVRYGNTLSGTVERTIRPGLTSRTFVSGGHVLYTHVYQRHVWYQFGRAIAYETFVPPVRYPAAYYAWALAAWSHPVIYSWGWQAQPWYPMYGALFTPYPVYTSPDLWMTDYIIAQSMQTAYQAQTPATAAEPSPQGALVAPGPDLGVAAPAPQPSDTVSTSQPDAPPPAPRASDTPSAPAALPPVITPQIKAQLNAQIKVHLQEQQAAAAPPVTLTTQSTPPALRPNHVFFQVVQPLEVPSGVGNGYCSLSTNDYIRRTGGMSNDDWMIPVVVELSRASDCPQGLQTRIGLNDLNAMENEQEAQVMEAMQAASKSMGPNGPPSGAGVHPNLIADGSAAADPSVLEAIREAQ
jgi:hypothetical protein